MRHVVFCVGVSFILMACGGSAVEQVHEHGPDPLEYTLYSSRTELFVEFPPLVVGQPVRFAAHVTQLGENFTPLLKGSVTVSLVVGQTGIRQTATQPASPGIYRLALKPSKPGTGKLIFDIEGDYRDRIVIEPVTVHASAEEAAKQIRPEAAANTITYLKEQAWRVDFANVPVVAQPFHQVIKAAGEIDSAPGDDVVVAAHAGGSIRFADTRLSTGTWVGNGQALFTLAGYTATDNIESLYKEAKANYEKAKKDVERAAPLVADKIVSERDFLAIKTDFENAETAFLTISKNYSAAGQQIASPVSGYVNDILVSQGQYVTAGMPLVTLSQNKRLRLIADVSQKHVLALPTVRTANFKTTYNETVHELQALNGRLISYGRTVDLGDPLIPVVFEFDNPGHLVPGSLVEVYLLTQEIPAALSLPVSALMEEQGAHYVFVQTGGESFEKREITLGGSNGNRVQVVSGIAAGERVVTKGAYQIKLASASGTVPAHGHEH